MGLSLREATLNFYPSFSSANFFDKRYKTAN